MSTSKESLIRNIKAFKQMKDDLVVKHAGKYALFYEGRLVGVYHDREAARLEAEQQFPGGEFAISPEIGSRPHSLGVRVGRPETVPQRLPGRFP